MVAIFVLLQTAVKQLSSFDGGLHQQPVSCDDGSLGSLDAEDLGNGPVATHPNCWEGHLHPIAGFP